MATSMKAALALAGGMALLAGCADYPYYDNGYGPGYGYDNGYAYGNGYGYDNGYAYGYDGAPGYYGAPGYSYYDQPGSYVAPPIGLGFAFGDGGWDHRELHGGHGRRGGRDWNGGHGDHGDRDHDRDHH